MTIQLASAPSTPQKINRWGLIVACLVATLRIAFGSASLPLFNDVDEIAHFDLVTKYASGRWPERQIRNLDKEAAFLGAWFGSTEFLRSPEFYNGVYPTPLWSIPPSRERETYANWLMSVYTGTANHEAHSPPVYYVVAALWYNLGCLLGLSSPNAAYWVRFLNIPLVVILMVVAARFCKAYFSTTVANTVPIIIALFPSTIFYSVNNDVLCPLSMVCALWLLVRWRAEPPRYSLSVVTGLAVSAAALVKLTNVMILAACLLVAILRTRDAMATKRLSREWTSIAALMLSAFGPFGGWLCYNRQVLGNWTGTAAKVSFLGWQEKPLFELLNHPLLTLSGQCIFWWRLILSFYQGDMNWHGGSAFKFAFPDLLCLLSGFAIIVGAWGAINRSARASTSSSKTNSSEALGIDQAAVAQLLSVLLTSLSVLFLMSLSLKYDFRDCVFPSRNYPYMNSGRLLYGVLVPVLALFVSGVELITRRHKIVTTVVLSVFVLMLVPPQYILFQSVVTSHYNWFFLNWMRP